ncbi:MAG: PQQ-dependent sugar dehydrogenase [Gammaproteobacteria bacterium]|nr:PQQ-dependent sugar dehydrogenase [Gammaproteobacteria bacterium]
MWISLTATLIRRRGWFLLPASWLVVGAAFGPAAAQEGPAAVVEMTTTLQFAPQLVEITVGETVEWRNVSPVVHTVTADPALANDPSFVSLPEEAEPFDSGAIAPDGTFSQTFTVAGTYEYFCVPHQSAGMRGTVVVSAEGSGDGGPGLDDPLPDPIPLSDVAIGLDPVLEGLTAPNWATSAPGLPDRLFVVDQAGLIQALDLSTGQANVFLDVSDRLVELGSSGPETFDERGLLGLAFHPGYQTNGLLYTYTSEPVGAAADFTTMPEGTEPNHQSVILEWQVPEPADPASAPDPATAREVLRIDEPQFNHDAGALVFDADGLLLIALGDGGNADDQGVGHGDTGNGQNTGNPLGAILRIDPLGTDSANGQYGIPPTNPFIGQAGVVEEIYAYGFRNPFRMSIDPETHELWVADAGQHDIEEVNLVSAGGNYGWNLKEGSFFFDPNGEDNGFATDEPPAGGVPVDLIDPVAEYDHDEGIAVIGGFVYRGADVPDLAGRYVFGDYGTAESGGRLFVLGEDGSIGELGTGEDAGLALRLLGFGRDAVGEIYVLANETGTPFGDTGVVLRVTGAESDDAGEAADVAPGGEAGEAEDVPPGEAGDASEGENAVPGEVDGEVEDEVPGDGVAVPYPVAAPVRPPE